MEKEEPVVVTVHVKKWAIFEKETTTLGALVKALVEAIVQAVAEAVAEAVAIVPDVVVVLNGGMKIEDIVIVITRGTFLLFITKKKK